MKIKKIVEGLDLKTFENDYGRNIKGIDNFEFEDDLMEVSTRQEITHEYNKELVRQALRKAGTEGVTPSEISKIIGLTPQTAKKYLDELCAIREAYKLKRNRTTTIYYNNGKPRHDFGLERIEDANIAFEVSLAEGPDESLLLHIIEKRYSLLDGEQIEGGVIIPIRLIPSLIEKVNKMYKFGGESDVER